MKPQQTALDSIGPLQDKTLNELGIEDDPPPDNVVSILAHYGVPGMRWGVRKSRVSVGDHDTGQRSQDYLNAKALRNIPPSRLSNQQLKLLNERMTLEQNYKKLNPTKVESGHAKLAKYVKMGTTVATAITLGAKFYKSPVGQSMFKKTAKVPVRSIPRVAPPRTFR